MVGTPGRSGGRRELGADRTQIDGLPTKPDDLPGGVGAVWDELLTQLQTHVLRKIDVHELRNLATLVCMSRTLATTMVEDPSDLKTQRNYLGMVDRIHRLSASFGLNPQDRKRMDLDAPTQMTPEEAWFQERTQRVAQRPQ